MKADLRLNRSGRGRSGGFSGRILKLPKLTVQLRRPGPWDIRQAPIKRANVLAGHNERASVRGVVCKTAPSGGHSGSGIIANSSSHRALLAEGWGLIIPSAVDHGISPADQAKPIT